MKILVLLIILSASLHSTLGAISCIHCADGLKLKWCGCFVNSQQQVLG
ncbi:hypothetical protein [Providencia sp. Me31A]